MKIRFNYILFFALCVVFLSCKKDNYDQPTSALTGKVVYKGEALGLEYNQVTYQVYQFGFGKIGAIGVIRDPGNANNTITLTTAFKQDGTYSLLLFYQTSSTNF